LEGGEKCGAIYAIENGSRPVQDLGQFKAGKRSRIAGLVKQFRKDRNTQIVARCPPVEARLPIGRRMVARPENPRGKDAVEKSLDQRRAKEMLALLAFEFDTERLFQRASDG